MKMPLNFAILKVFTTEDRASADDVIAALRADYGHYRGLHKKAVEEALKTAEVNGLLEVDEVTLDENDDLCIYYTANAQGRDTIKGYLA